jgi:cation transport regulator
MPYQSINELPNNIKTPLPEHAQEIWKEAFNSAYEDHKDEKNAEETAIKIAWSAVKNSYHKNEDGEWVEDED